MKFSIRKKLAVLVLLVMLPALAVILYNGWCHQQLAIERALHQAKDVANNLAMRQKLLEASTNEFLEALGSFPSMRNMDGSKSTLALRSIAEHSNTYNSIMLTDLQGTVVASSQEFVPGRNVADQRAFQRALATRNLAYGGYRKSTVTGRHVLSCAHPVYDTGQKLVGILNAGLRLDQYGDAVKDIALPPNSTIYMADEDGIRLFNRHFPTPKSDVYPVGEAIRANVWQDIVARESGAPFTNIGADGRRRLYCVQKLSRVDGEAPYFYVGVSILEETVLSGPKRELQKNLFLLVAAGLVSLMASYFAGTVGFVRRIEKLGNVAKAYASGVYSERTGGVGGDDELSQLAKDIDQIGSEAVRQFEEIKHAGDALSESERRFRALFTAVGDPVLVADKDTGILVECNEAAEHYFGRSRDELIGQPQRMLHSSDTPLVEGVTEDFKRKVICPRHQEEIRLLAAGGELRNVEVSASTFEIGESKLILGVFRDITDRKRAQDALQVERTILRDILESTLAGYWDWDLVNNTEYLSPMLKRMFGYEDHELENRPETWQKLAHPEDLPGVYEKFRLHVESRGQVPFYNELRYQHRDGSWVWVICSGRVFEWTKDWQPVRMVGCHVDISKQKNLVEESKQAKQQAELANRAKSEFLANMSHEIRTPLNGVLGMLQIIRDCEVSSDVESYAEMALRAGQRLTGLLGDILDLSRIEAGHMPIVSKPFAFADIFTALAETFSPMNLSKSLSLEIRTSSDVPADVVGDEIRVRQVLFNLVGNAMKFTEAGEVRVEVSMLLPHPLGMARLLIVISDTGSGIPDDKVGQICAPFVQVDESFTRQHQGAGLGLSIARKLIDAMGGTLTFESTEGQGTSVYLMLPFGIIEDSANPAKPESMHDVEAVASLRILLVEDEEISRLSARLQLEKIGHQVVTANNGEEALEALRAGRYDCVLMDVQMDVLDGVAATRAIRSGASRVLDAQVPIVAMTAYAMAGDRERFLEAGMNDYVAKPVQMEELKKALERVIGKNS